MAGRSKGAISLLPVSSVLVLPPTVSVSAGPFGSLGAPVLVAVETGASTEEDGAESIDKDVCRETWSVPSVHIASKVQSI